MERIVDVITKNMPAGQAQHERGKQVITPIERLARLYSMTLEGLKWFEEKYGAELEPVFSRDGELCGIVIHKGMDRLLSGCGISPEQVCIVSRDGFERYEFDVGGVRFFGYED